VIILGGFTTDKREYLRNEIYRQTINYEVSVPYLSSTFDELAHKWLTLTHSHRPTLRQFRNFCTNIFRMKHYEYPLDTMSYLGAGWPYPGPSPNGHALIARTKIF